MTTELYTRLMKLHALATKGIGGEAMNAKHLFEAMLSQNGISLQEFEQHGKTKAEFSLPMTSDHVLVKLFYQIVAATECKGSIYDDEYISLICKYVGAETRRDMRAYLKTKKGTADVRGTAEQVEDFKLQWEIYSAAAMEEIQTTIIAFIHANRIFPPKSDDNDDTPRPPLTDLQKKALQRAWEMEALPLRKRIG